MQHLPGKIALSFCLGLAAVTATSSSAAAQTAEQAWLRYRPLKKRLGADARRSQGTKPHRSFSGLRACAWAAIARRRVSPDAGPDSIVLATVNEIGRDKRKSIVPALEPDEFLISWSHHQSPRELDIVGGSDRGLLYGVLALLRHLAEGADMSRAIVREKPAMPIRWVDQWDNADGSIERGYAGRSIFFEGGKVRDDLKPV